jgi:hypothetical protein
MEAIYPLNRKINIQSLVGGFLINLKDINNPKTIKNLKVFFSKRCLIIRASLI